MIKRISSVLLFNSDISPNGIVDTRIVSHDRRLFIELKQFHLRRFIYDCLSLILKNTKLSTEELLLREFQYRNHNLQNYACLVEVFDENGEIWRSNCCHMIRQNKSFSKFDFTRILLDKIYWRSSLAWSKEELVTHNNCLLVLEKDPLPLIILEPEKMSTEFIASALCADSQVISLTKNIDTMLEFIDKENI